MPKKRNVIAWMDKPEWMWINDGEEYWKRPDGSLSDQRHARNILTGDVLSVRQVQNEQRKNRAAFGVPKPPTVKRQGVVRKQMGKFTKLHGNQMSIYARDIDSLQEYVQATVPDPLTRWGRGIIILHYTEKLLSEDESEHHGKGNYTTLTYSWHYVDTFRETDVPWNQARERMQNYHWNPNSEPSPFQLFLLER